MMFRTQDTDWTQDSVASLSVPSLVQSEPETSGADSASSKANMVGTSLAMREVFEQIRRFATCDAPMLITGESGTGKELVARAIHEQSRRARQPFVAINCAAFTSTLIGSELFGYEKGAFTGATTRKRGLIEHANNGTLLLDEIGDMPLDLQAHLLRFLQEGEIVRIGGHEPIRVNVRIIAATNVRLREAIAAGKLREDLYYRLNVLNLHVPPLRERHGDIESLATFFLQQMAHESARDVDGFAPEAMAAMQAYPWPGNVRELIGTIRRAVVLSDGPQIQADDLGLEAPPEQAAEVSQAGCHTPVSERDLLLNTLRRFDCNISRTAQELKVSRITIYRRLRRNHLVLRQEFLEQHSPI